MVGGPPTTHALQKPHPSTSYTRVFRVECDVHGRDDSIHCAALEVFGPAIGHVRQTDCRCSDLLEHDLPLRSEELALCTLLPNNSFRREE